MMMMKYYNLNLVREQQVHPHPLPQQLVVVVLLEVKNQLLPIVVFTHLVLKIFYLNQKLIVPL
jgi:hypothetical protein